MRTILMLLFYHKALQKSTQMHTRAHMLLCTEITREREQTFRAQDEVVNVWPCRHAWALTALFNHPSWGHHLYVDNLLRKKTTQPTLFRDKNSSRFSFKDLQILTKYFNLDITCATCMKAFHN